MQSKPQSIYELFDHKRRYTVPLFQRQYVWNQEIQWEPLWEDIRSKAVIHLERPSDDKVAPHFLGALVLNQIHSDRVANRASEDHERDAIGSA